MRSATPPGVGRRLIQRLVPHALSKMAGLATPPGGNPTGASGLHATAACSLIWAADQTARATTDSHREARPARIASGASTPHRPPQPLRAGLPLGPSPHDVVPTPSLSQWRSELRPPDSGRAGLASFVGVRSARNGCNQRLATLREPHQPILSRVRCIAWFSLCRPQCDRVHEFFTAPPFLSQLLPCCVDMA